jgi:hypothetical protein
LRWREPGQKAEAGRWRRGKWEGEAGWLGGLLGPLLSVVGVGGQRKPVATTEEVQEIVFCRELEGVSIGWGAERVELVAEVCVGDVRWVVVLRTRRGPRCPERLIAGDEKRS